MTLLDTTHKFIEKEKLFGLLDSVLVGVSGGKDSMCLLHVLLKFGCKISVAHVNYKLRRAESDKDEQLVANYCQQHQIEYHVYRVTKDDAQMLQSQNFQEAARQLRYDFFERLRIKLQYDKIAVAHHQNDVAETFLMNAMRGSGVGGLRSIQSLNGTIVRPFLPITQEEISNFASKFNIPFRIDESNKSNKYSRNYIRNKITPNLKKRWPGAIRGIGNSAKLLSNESQLLQHLVQQEKPKWYSSKNGLIQVGPLSKLVLTPGHESLLWYFLKEYDLSISSIGNIFRNYKNSGSDYSTLSHSIILDRDYIKIETKKYLHPTLVKIDKTGIFQTAFGQISIETYQDSSTQHECVEIVDYSKVVFPLLLRPWENGDKWQALGMSGKHKKVSDYLIDQKIDRLTKNKVLVLEDANGHIIWLVGFRISELIKTSQKTVSKLHLSWNSSKL